jgi:hypothetical protein
MAAIVTDSFRRNNAQFFLDNIADSTYYLGLGKSEQWATDEESTSLVIPIPLGIPSDDSDIKSNLTTLIKINTVNSGLVIPQIKWKAGARYKAYSPADPDCFYPSTLVGGGEVNPCYAVISGRIYLCLKAGDGAVANIPGSTDYRALSYGSDGYIWILVDNVVTATANINTDQFISISSGVAADSISAAIENDGGGLLYGFTLTSGGSGYTSTNSVQFVARKINDTEITITCPVNINSTTGAIESVLLPADYSYIAESSKGIVDGYFIFDPAETGSGAVIVPHIAPARGFAYKPSATLPSWYVGIAVDAVDNISDDGLYIPYRQISVLKDIEYSEGSSIDTLAALRYLTLASAPTSTPAVGSLITFGTTGIKAYFDNYSTVSVGGSTQHRVYFHQNSTTGYGVVPSTGSFTAPNNNTINYLTVNNNEYTPRSGEVIFAENRKKINRQSAQTEEIKIIIQF